MMPTCSCLHYKTAISRLRVWLFWVLCLLCLMLGRRLTAQTQTQSQPAQADHTLTKSEANELFRSIDDILQFASEDTRLPIRRTVKRQLTSRDEVEQDLKDRMKDDEDAQRLQRSELVLKKFGFLPHNFDLQSFLVSLMKEQVAGYYNAKNKTVYLLDWIPVSQQKLVMAHELTHALQDQNFDLKKWLAGNDSKDSGKASEVEKDAQEIANDEQQTARQALVEGQGMAVLIDYMLKNSGQSVTTATAFVETLKQNITSGEDSPVYSKAPMYIRESLGFPYSYGLSFVQALLLKGGKELAFAGALRNPPQTSREIMMPETYLAGQGSRPIALPQMSTILGKNYERYDVGAVGQFDLMVLLRQFTSQAMADKLTPEWRGGAYYAALNHMLPAQEGRSTDTQQQKSGKEKQLTTKSLALLYVSRWSSPEMALTFAKVYATMLGQRYRSADLIDPEASAAANAANGAKDQPKKEEPLVRPIPSMSSHWITEEGDVLIEPQGDSVLVLESFDLKTQAALSQAVWQANGMASQTSQVRSK